MLDVYLDDSGTHGGPHCFLAGYLASTARWEAFANQWGKLCRKYLDGKTLKMKAANREKDPRHVPENGLVEFAQCIADHAEIEIWSALPDYSLKAIQDRYGAQFDRYRTCFLGVIEEVINNHTLIERGERIAWWFDHQGGAPPDQESELEASLIRAFNNTRANLPADQKPLLHSITFTDDEVVIPLQAADFFAWHKRRSQTDGPNVPERPSYQILRRSNMTRIDVVWFDHKLEDLLDRITAPHKTTFPEGKA